MGKLPGAAPNFPSFEELVAAQEKVVGLDELVALSQGAYSSLEAILAPALSDSLMGSTPTGLYADYFSLLFLRPLGIERYQVFLKLFFYSLTEKPVTEGAKWLQASWSEVEELVKKECQDVTPKRVEDSLTSIVSAARLLQRARKHPVAHEMLPYYSHSIFTNHVSYFAQNVIRDRLTAVEGQDNRDAVTSLELLLEHLPQIMEIDIFKPMGEWLTVQDGLEMMSASLREKLEWSETQISFFLDYFQESLLLSDNTAFYSLISQFVIAASVLPEEFLKDGGNNYPELFHFREVEGSPSDLFVKNALLWQELRTLYEASPQAHAGWLYLMATQEN